MLRFRLYSTITPGCQLITFLLSALPLNISLLSREFPIGTLFRFSIPLIINLVFFANQKYKKKKRTRFNRDPPHGLARLGPSLSFDLGLSLYYTPIFISKYWILSIILFIISIVNFANQKQK